MGTVRRGLAFGYWDAERFVRSPGPWAAPDNGSKAANQRLR
ncbi:MAG TPA: hypothetical protein VIG37_02415 [Methylomirabilota bacterium]|jgi:hypothetical protein